MRLPFVIGLVLAVAACDGGIGQQAAVVTGTGRPASTQAPVPSTTEDGLPPEPDPVREGVCPYLPTSFVADTNGQRVSQVRLSADEPHPACFFYRPDGGEQLRVEVLVGVEPMEAKAVVDRAAPLASSDPATLPGGWQGGRQPTATGAVFAVAKAGSAVVVVTNQKQTIKASRIAERAITSLGL